MFTPANWNAPQTVTVTGVDDLVVDGDQPFTIVLGARGDDRSGYSGLDPDDVTGTNVDNDIAGIVVTPTSGLSRPRRGGTDHFHVVLLSQPIGDVTVPSRRATPPKAPRTPASIVFTPSNWNAPQTITVHGVDDSSSTATSRTRSSISPARLDRSGYNNLDRRCRSASRTSTTTAPASRHARRAASSSTEFGDTATFTIVLTQQPTANVRSRSRRAT